MEPQTFNFIFLQQQYPALTLRTASPAEFRPFKILEPQLVSVLEQGSAEFKAASNEEVFLLECSQKPAAVCSIVTTCNHLKQEPRKYYARIDFVITQPTMRGMGAGRMVLLGALSHLLAQQSSSLYSISCLAGHAAVAHILTSLNFNSKEKPGQTFVHQEFKISEESEKLLANQVNESAFETAKLLHYRLRQRSGKPHD
ncbi:MAG: hypothetical protein KDD62_15495 [Bdellovibrionales bacterium]|nr:hypothetical protein [Bdellovibrionales bacterium]